VHKIDISKNTQKEPWFLEINPNGRIPALTDTFSDGEKIRLFESGSIQQYLVDQYDKDYKISYPRGTREFYEMTNVGVGGNPISCFGLSQDLLLRPCPLPKQS
jgi:glutathione S-transferase